MENFKQDQLDNLKNESASEQNTDNLTAPNFSRDQEIQEFNQVLSEINAELLSEEQDESTSQTVVSESVSEFTVQEEVSDNPEAKEHSPSADAQTESNIETPVTAQTPSENNQTRVEEEKVDTAKPSLAETNSESDKENSEESDLEKEYKFVILDKTFSKVKYDLTSPELTTAEVKQRIYDGQLYNFNCFMLSTRKFKAVKKLTKNLKVQVVIAQSESTALAKRWEIRQAKRCKPVAIQVDIPLSIIKENKKRALVSEFLKYKKLVGKKCDFIIGINAKDLSVEEFNFALSCSAAVKPTAVAIISCSNMPASYLLSAVKTCGKVCKIQTDLKLKDSKDLNYLSQRGISYFALSNAVAFAETVKHE